MSHKNGGNIFQILSFIASSQIVRAVGGSRPKSRFVEKHDLGIAYKRASDTDTTPHTTGEFDLHLVDGVFEVNEAQHSSDFRFDLFFGHALFVQAVSYVVVHGE